VERVYNILQPSVRFTLDDVTELPEVVYRDIPVDLTPDQKTVYKQISAAGAAVLQGKTVTAANGGVAMGKLLQVIGGWLYVNNPEFVRLDCSPRLVALVDAIEESDRKIIVAIPYRHMIEGISKILSMKEVNIDHCVVHGDTPHREVIFTQYQNTSKYKVMLCHPLTVSHGLTLTAADTIIWYLPVTSWETYEQFNARIRRIGQKHRHRVLHLISTPLERRIYKVLQGRGDMQQMLLEMVEHATEELT
jgi:SNF2 family DNA or RNA helicase